MNKIIKEHASINGASIYYEFIQHDQNKPTLVMLHGFLSSMFCYRKMIPLLKDDFNLITIDTPPFGKSEKEMSGKKREIDEITIHVFSLNNLAL